MSYSSKDTAFFRVPVVLQQGAEKANGALREKLEFRLISCQESAYFPWWQLCWIYIFCSYRLYPVFLSPSWLQSTLFITSFLKSPSSFLAVWYVTSLLLFLSQAASFSKAFIVFVFTGLLWGKNGHRCMGRWFWSTSKG